MTDLLDDLLPVAPRVDPEVERLSAEVHGLYQAEIKRQGREERHNDDYYALPDHVKELDRVFVRWHLARLHDHARPSSNGAVGYETTCFGCGNKITVKRRPLPGKHNWCDDCKANGEPAAQRARDYRSRKGEQT